MQEIILLFISLELLALGGLIVYFFYRMFGVQVFTPKSPDVYTPVEKQTGDNVNPDWIKEGNVPIDMFRPSGKRPISVKFNKKDQYTPVNDKQD